MMITTTLAGANPGAAPAPGTTDPEGAATSTHRADSSVRIRVTHHVKAGKDIVLRGKIRPAGSRQAVVEVGKRKVRTLRTRRDGSFGARWPARRAGVYRTHVVVRGTTSVRPARSARKRVNVYRPAAASWYGPGFYGSRTACGKTLTASTLGVANKSLPCGAKVTLRHRGRSVRVPVIDRGPFSGDREYDLTGATKAKLRFGSTGTVLSTR